MWLELPWQQVRPLPTDQQLGENTVASTRVVTATLSAEHTRALLRDLPAELGAKVDEILLAALGRALSSCTGLECVLVDLEALGRETPDESVDASRTVGWFTAMHPVLFETGAGDLGALVREVRTRLAPLREQQLGFGSARALLHDEGVADALRALPRAEISFAYLGELGGARDASLRPSSLSIGPARSPRARRAHLLELVASVSEGCLAVHWTFSQNVHREATIRALSEAMTAALVGLASKCTASRNLAPDAERFGWSAEDVGDLLAGVEPRRERLHHPLFEELERSGGERVVYTSRLSPDTHWLLAEHRLGERALLPGTAFLELARAALQHHTGASGALMSEVYFARPLFTRDGRVTEVRTILEQQGGELAFSVQSRGPDEEAWQDHASGRIAAGPPSPARPHDLEELQARTAPGGNGLREPAWSAIYPPGTRWDCLSSVKLGDGEGLARLELPEAVAAEVEHYGLHPALLDVAVGFLAHGLRGDTLYLPFSYRSVRVHGPLPRRVVSHAKRLDTSTADELEFDVLVLDEHGRELAAIEELTLRRVDAVPGATHETVALRQRTPGNLDSLELQPTPRRKPGAGEVEIAVAAAGLNFKEILGALGAVPAAAGGPLGWECAGTIAALGEGVDGLAVGDEVMALGAACFSPFVTTPAAQVAPLPPGASFEEAATMPVAFLTAYYALVTLGRLQRGERVLIHAAAGGVGMAAVQIGRWLGAEVYATAGTREKRALVRRDGVEHVMDSRSTDFAQEVMRATGGRGVDVVLNSLAGELAAAGLTVLAPYGRFLELGMRDIYEGAQLTLRPFEKSLSYHAIQANTQMPEFRAVWGELVARIRAGDFRPLPFSAFPIDEAAAAFDHMARAKHVGKVVLTLPAAPAAAARRDGDLESWSGSAVNK